MSFPKIHSCAKKKRNIGAYSQLYITLQHIIKTLFFCEQFFLIIIPAIESGQRLFSTMLAMLNLLFFPFYYHHPSLFISYPHVPQRCFEFFEHKDYFMVLAMNHEATVIAMTHDIVWRDSISMNSGHIEHYRHRESFIAI